MTSSKNTAIPPDLLMLTLLLILFSATSIPLVYIGPNEYHPGRHYNIHLCYAANSKRGLYSPPEWHYFIPGGKACGVNILASSSFFVVFFFRFLALLF